MRYTRTRHRTPTFRSWGKVGIHRFFDSIHLISPFLISPTTLFYAAALWAGLLAAAWKTAAGSSLVTEKNFQWSVREIRRSVKGTSAPPLPLLPPTPTKGEATLLLVQVS